MNNYVNTRDDLIRFVIPEPFGPNSELKFGFGACLKDSIYDVCRSVKFLDSNRAQNWINNLTAPTLLLALGETSAYSLVTVVKGTLSKVTDCVSHIATDVKE